MNVIETIAHFQKLWRIVLPHIAEPPQEAAARWCAYPLASVEAAILRTGKRFAPGKLDTPGLHPTSAYKYTTATARTMAEKEQGRGRIAPHPVAPLQDQRTCA